MRVFAVAGPGRWKRRVLPDRASGVPEGEGSMNRKKIVAALMDCRTMELRI
jgi:hypothetical protein